MDGHGFLLIAALMAGLLPATQAAAQSISITATGTVPGSCSIAVASPFGNADLSAAGSVQATATVDCNTGFKLHATSSNGALVTATAVPANSVFVDRLGYGLTFSLTTDGNTNLSASCTSAHLGAGQSGCALSPGNDAGLSSGGRTAINRTASLGVSWAPPALPARLVAGSYSDTITFSIGAVP